MGSSLEAIVDSAVSAMPPMAGSEKVIPVVTKGGPAHEERALVFLFRAGESEPLAVVKVAFDDQERDFIRREYANLRALHDLDPPFAHLMPRPLALREGEGLSWMAETRVEGRRMFVPPLGRRGGRLSRGILRRFLRGSYSWGRDLAAVTPAPRPEPPEFAERVERFVDLFDPPVWLQSDLREFASDVSRSQTSRAGCWQHGDLSVGNVLYSGRKLAVLDWENARVDRPPWYDAVNSLLLVTSLAQRQSHEGSLVETASWLLDRSYWVGQIVERELTGFWDHQVPLGWGVAIGLVEAAIARSENTLPQWREWGEFVELVFAPPAEMSPLAWLRP